MGAAHSSEERNKMEEAREDRVRAEYECERWGVRI